MGSVYLNGRCTDIGHNKKILKKHPHQPCNYSRCRLNRYRLVTGDPAHAVFVAQRRQPGELLGRAQAHGTAAAGRVRPVPEVGIVVVVVIAAPQPPRPPRVAVVVHRRCPGRAHSVHPDVVQQLQRRRRVHGHHGQLVRVCGRLLLHDHVAAVAVDAASAATGHG